MKIMAFRIEGEIYVKLQDHKDDVERYKARIAQLERQRRDPFGPMLDAMEPFENLGRKPRPLDGGKR